MPKNLKVLLFVVLAVNAMNDMEADFVQGELQLSTKTSYRLQKEGVLRIEKQLKGRRLTAVLVTKDKSSTLNGLRFNILEKTSKKDAFYSGFQEAQKDNVALVPLSWDHYQAPQITTRSVELVQIIQLVLYDDEEAQSSTLCA